VNEVAEGDRAQPGAKTYQEGCRNQNTALRKLAAIYPTNEPVRDLFVE
jgi:hypothetical protein